MVARLRGGAPAVDVRILDKIVRIWITGISGIISLKEGIRTKTGIPPERQILSFEGKVLENGVLTHFAKQCLTPYNTLAVPANFAI